MGKSNRQGKALVMTREQIGEVVAELKYPHNAIALISYWSASRAGEIVALTPAAVGRYGLNIRQQKTKATKEVGYTPELEAAIDLVQNRSDRWMFPGRDGEHHITLRAFQKQLDQALDWLGIQGASSHSFRRSMATHLYQSGVDLESIRQMTGHRSLASLTQYIDIPQLEAQSRIAEAIAQWRGQQPN